jgi:hypothetical protein
MTLRQSLKRGQVKASADEGVRGQAKASAWAREGKGGSAWSSADCSPPNSPCRAGSARRSSRRRSSPGFGGLAEATRGLFGGGGKLRGRFSMVSLEVIGGALYQKANEKHILSQGERQAYPCSVCVIILFCRDSTSKSGTNPLCGKSATKVLDQQVERGLVLVGGNVRDAEDVLQQKRLRGEFLHQQEGVPHGVRFWVKLPPPGRGEE